MDDDEARGRGDGDNGARPPAPPERERGRLRALGSAAFYLFSLESHLYAFAVSAAVFLSFFPFLVLILSLAQNVLRWQGMADLIYVAVRDGLPGDPGLVDFVIRNLRAAVASRGRAETASLVALLLSSNAAFTPHEVALNRLWRFPADRPWWRNQLLSLSLAFACGSLALLAVASAAWSAPRLARQLGGLLKVDTTNWIAVKLGGVPCAALALLLIYRFLPNGRVPFGRVLRLSLAMAVVLELGRYVYLVAWPLLGFRRAYGPFFISATILLWAYLAALLVLGGAHAAARGGEARSG
jgi:uncharacterized BrkB/YihY/UPF0761 family membrane protein